MNIKIEESNGKKKYWVNDVAYDRIEDIPAEFQEHFVDKDGNGMPDQFDSLMNMANKMKDGKTMEGLFDALWSKKSEAKDSAKASSAAAPFEHGEERPSIIKSIIKFSIGVLFVLLIAFVYTKFKESKNPANPSSEEISLPPDAAPIASEGGMRITVEDPNEAPYHMLGVIYFGEEKLLSFDLPDGEIIGSSDSTLQVSMSVQEGTNLNESTFNLVMENGPCPGGEEEAIGVTIGSVDFVKSVNGDAGAGQQFLNYRYTTGLNGKCLIFTLMMHSGNASAYDPPVENYNEVWEVTRMENILKTISTF